MAFSFLRWHSSDFSTPKIRGRNEQEIFENFSNDYPWEDFQMIWTLFETLPLNTKDNQRSVMIRQQANVLYSNGGDLERCLDLYSESLRYATYKSKPYAIALANRSAILFKLDDYEKCIEDIDLCLEAEYPNILKPKVYLRKCECFRRSGKLEEMFKIADEFGTFLKNFGESTAAKYRKELFHVVTSNENPPIAIIDNPSELPYLDENKAFPGASKNVELKKDQNGDVYVSSSKPLKKGDVIFVEKIYASCLYNSQSNYCQYCLKSIINGVPCKSCVKRMYCTEVCRNLAWNEFHQWECYADQVDLLDNFSVMALALRVVFKACQNETIPPPEKDIPMNKYSSMYHLHPFLRNKKVLPVYIKSAMIFVNYLKKKTTFFEYLKSQPHFLNKNNKDLMMTIGGLLIRHASQMQSKALIVAEFTELTVKDIGRIACSAVSQLSHSCDANTIYYFHNDVIVLKALTDIDANTRLTVSHNVPQLKELLWNTFDLNCTCLPSSNSLMNLENLDAYICVRCRGPAVVELKPFYKCLKCGNSFEMPPDIIQKMVLFRSFLNQFYTFKDIDKAKKALALGKQFLQQYHHSFRRLYEEMGNCHYENGDTVGALLMFQLTLQLEEKRFGPCTVDAALSQMRYSAKILQCLQMLNYGFCSNTVKTELKKVKSALEKATEFSSSFCPVLLNFIRILKLTHSAEEFAANMLDMNIDC